MDDITPALLVTEKAELLCRFQERSIVNPIRVYTDLAHSLCNFYAGARAEGNSDYSSALQAFRFDYAHRSIGDIVEGTKLEEAIQNRLSSFSTYLAERVENSELLFSVEINRLAYATLISSLKKVVKDQEFQEENIRILLSTDPWTTEKRKHYADQFDFSAEHKDQILGLVYHWSPERVEDVRQQVERSMEKVSITYASMHQKELPHQELLAATGRVICHADSTLRDAYVNKIVPILNTMETLTTDLSTFPGLLEEAALIASQKIGKDYYSKVVN